MKKMVLIGLMLVLALTSCKSKSNITATEKNDMVNSEEPNVKLNDIWALQTIEGSDYSMKTIEKGVQIPILEFHLKDMKYFGNDGCNSIFGAIENVSALELVFGVGGGTRKFCVDDKVSPVFSKQMSLVRGYAIEKTILSLKDENGKVLMTFRKVD
jgi:heat shock protein HslJ